VTGNGAIHCRRCVWGAVFGCCENVQLLARNHTQEQPTSPHLLGAHGRLRSHHLVYACIWSLMCCYRSTGYGMGAAVHHAGRARQHVSGLAGILWSLVDPISWPVWAWMELALRASAAPPVPRPLILISIGICCVATVRASTSLYLHCVQCCPGIVSDSCFQLSIRCGLLGAVPGCSVLHASDSRQDGVRQTEESE